MFSSFFDFKLSFFNVDNSVTTVIKIYSSILLLSKLSYWSSGYAYIIYETDFDVISLFSRP